jgi:hypothetical protein
MVIFHSYVKLPEGIGHKMGLSPVSVKAQTQRHGFPTFASQVAGQVNLGLQQSSMGFLRYAMQAGSATRTFRMVLNTWDTNMNKYTIPAGFLGSIKQIVFLRVFLHGRGSNNPLQLPFLWEYEA